MAEARIDASERFARLGTAQIADALVRLELPVHGAPGGISPLVPGTKIAGAAATVVLTGYLDHLLECLYRASPGDVLVIDNRGRSDESCFGDLIALEARACGLAGVVIWGLHRDGAELVEIGLPVFSYGSYPLGLQRVSDPVPDPFARCRFGDETLEPGDVVFADDDGVVFVPPALVGRVLDVAESIFTAESTQAQLIRDGMTLKEQLQFDLYLKEKSKNPSLTLGEHMRKIGRHV